MTWVPGFQYSFGRQCTREPCCVSGNHAQLPSVGSEVRTDNAFSTAARSWTGPAKSMMIGAAMPTS